MLKNYFQESVSSFKELYLKFVVQVRKFKALKNYAKLYAFKHENYLGLLENCFKEGFLGAKESEFLEYMLDKYELRCRYHVYCYKNRWLKSEMQRVQKPQDTQIFLDFSKLDKSTNYNYPIELIANASKDGARIGTC